MPIQRWRCPLAVQAKSAVFAAATAALTIVFFPLWFAIPVAAVLGAWALSLCAMRSEIRVDAGAGVLTVRAGLLFRRIALANVSAVRVDRAKVSLARSDGWEMSVYAWRKSRLDRWLGAPVVAGDVAHAISAAAAAARPDQPGAAARRARTPRLSRRLLAPALLGCAGLAAGGAALLVRVSWPSPLLTALGAILALALGVSGILYVLAALWLLLREVREGRPARSG